MNREIKFRVWDKKENKFFEPIYEAYKGNLIDLSIGLGGDLFRRTLQIPSEHQSCFPNRYELMQFTGLKDKNSKEIYEGDIVKAEWHWQDGKIVDLSYESEFFYSVQEYAIEDGLEIIGNIYQTPELLTKKTKII